MVSEFFLTTASYFTWKFGWVLQVGQLECYCCAVCWHGHGLFDVAQAKILWHVGLSPFSTPGWPVPLWSLAATSWATSANSCALSKQKSAARRPCDPEEQVLNQSLTADAWRRAAHIVSVPCNRRTCWALRHTPVTCYIMASHGPPICHSHLHQHKSRPTSLPQSFTSRLGLHFCHSHLHKHKSRPTSLPQLFTPSLGLHLCHSHLHQG